MSAAEAPILLSRLQFALATSFHIIFPALTVGLALLLVAFEVQWLRTADRDWYRLCRFFGRLFALAFGVGVATGIPLEFQFGTNFGRFSAATNGFFGVVLGFEGTLAFMLESGFIGLMLFGWDRLSPRLHLVATCLVAFGASLSAFWIVAANSWMQCPAGVRMVDGVIVLDDFWAAVLNPDTPYAFAHMWLACVETAAFALGGVAAWYLLQGRHEGLFRKALGVALVAALAAAPLQVLVGDQNGLAVAHHQPAKLAAIEAHWDTNLPGEPAAWTPVAWPDPERERNAFEVRIPYVLSLLITHSFTGRVKGLKEFPKEDRPPILIPFYAFRGMVGVGFALAGLVLWTLWAWRRRLLHQAAATGRAAAERTWLLRAWVAAGPLALLAIELGWATREVGRQPWLIQGLLRTSAAGSDLPASAVLASLLTFAALYAVLGVAFVAIAGRMLAAGPDEEVAR